MEFEWIDPGGRLREHVVLTPTPRGERPRYWSWLKLYRPFGGGVMSMFEPSFGMREFLGEWKVVVSLDHRKLLTLPFTVIC